MKRRYIVQAVLAALLLGSLACAATAVLPDDGGPQAPAESPPVPAEDKPPSSGPSPYEVAVAAYYAGDYDAALAAINQSLQANPDFADALAVRALLNFRLESTVASGKADLDRALAQNDDSAWAHASAAWYAGAIEGDLDKALAEGQRAVELDPNLAVGYRMLGAAYADLGDLESSVAAYSQALELEPDYTGALFDRGWDYYNLGDGEAARADFLHFLQLQPDDTDAYVGLGSAYELLGDVDSTVDAYENAVRTGPDNPYAYWNRGYTYAGMERYEDAIADYDRVIEYDPGDPYIYGDRGWAYENLGDADAALADYRTWVEQDGSNPDALNALAYTLAIYDRDLDEALLLINQAVDAAPDDPFYLDSKAYVLYKLGNLDEALPLFQQALEGGELYANYGLGLIYQDRGQTDLAISALSAFLEDFPDDLNSEEVQQRLDALGG